MRWERDSMLRELELLFLNKALLCLVMKLLLDTVPNKLENSRLFLEEKGVITLEILPVFLIILMIFLQ